MTLHDGELPRKSERFFMMQHTSQHPQLRFSHSTVTLPTFISPWAVASYGLAIVALVIAVASPLLSCIASALAILCGAVAIAVMVNRRHPAGVWMALLGIGVSTLPFVLTLIAVLTQNRG